MLFVSVWRKLVGNAGAWRKGQVSFGLLDECGFLRPLAPLLFFIFFILDEPLQAILTCVCTNLLNSI